MSILQGSSILVTGGTGFTGRDSTPEVLLPLLDKDMPGFGELFRQISREEIGTSTIQSRAIAGITNGTLICCLPGSTGACLTAWEKILLAQLDSREALVMALNEYQGAVVLISHDRHLVEACADRLWLVAGGKVEPYDGDMEDYKRLILQGPEAAQKARDKAAAAEADAASAQEKRREAAQKRSQLKPLKQKIDAAEKEMARLQEKIAKIDDMLADPEFFQTDPERAAKFAKERAFCEKKLVKTEEDWLELSAEFEEAG